MRGADFTAEATITRVSAVNSITIARIVMCLAFLPVGLVLSLTIKTIPARKPRPHSANRIELRFLAAVTCPTGQLIPANCVSILIC